MIKLNLALSTQPTTSAATKPAYLRNAANAKAPRLWGAKISCNHACMEHILLGL